MKTIYLPLICAIVIFSSCSSAYKTAETPDDVYYSPGSQRQTSSSVDDQYYNANSDDQYLMMKSQDPARWSYFDDYSYDNFYSPYSMYNPYSLYSPYGFGYSPFGFYSGFGFGYSPFMSFGFGYYGADYLSNYYLWNGIYNPYYGGVIVVAKTTPAYYTQLHPFALTNYTGSAINNSNTFRSYNPSTRTAFTNPQNRFTRFTNSAVNNSNSNTNSNRFNSNRFNSNNNNSFFRSQSTMSTRSFGGASFGGGGGGRSFSRGR